MQLPILAAAILSLAVLDCPASPNCVSSLASDPARRVEPLHYPAGQREKALKALLQVLHDLPRTKIIAQTDTAVRAVVRSALFRFKDDLEFHFDLEAPAIHIRSASRTGYWDMGVNRGRVGQIRSAFTAAIAEQP